MLNKRKIMYDIHIKESSNNYLLVKVGCATFCFPNDEDGRTEMFGAIGSYLINPRDEVFEYNQSNEGRTQPTNVPLDEGQAIAR